MKINKSEIARHMGVYRRTVDKYLNGFEPTKKRNRQSIIDKYYPIIEKLLSDSSEQKFYYKLILWQYLKDKHGLTCAYSTFRAYILKHDEFNRYFMKGYQRLSPKGKTRF
ncbi:hypothetical protein MCS34_09585 [Staphylococcus aureus]|nr:hypothetical protein [Staphylococcus aureus]MCG5200445.1 hypothetical protein [Staphylococcus aureus]WIZ24665.1 hypothetical protein PCL75_08855 [Staphylococcus aureus]